MRRRSSPSLLLILAVSGACSADNVQPTVATGRWGGEGYNLTASPGALVLSNPCNSITFPLRDWLAPGRHFSIDGTVSGSSWNGQVGLQWRASGVLMGDSAVVALSHRSVLNFYTAGDTAWSKPDTMRFSGPPRTDFLHICAF